MKAKPIDIEAIIAQFQSNHGPKCGVSMVTPEQRAYIEALGAEPRVQSSTIARAFAARWPNVRMADHTIRHHRTGKCLCGK